MNPSYENFAAVYDELMTEIPYDAYTELLDAAMGGIKGKRILDIGCGTGILSVKLAKKGAYLTGVDLSADMLSIAAKRAVSLSLTIPFEQQPMQQLEGFQDFDGALIAIDSLNYVLEREAVAETFARIYRSLKMGGTLLFDVHSLFKMDVIFLESPFTFDNGRIAYIWETDKADYDHSVYSELAFFVRQNSGLYVRFDEVHEQRSFPVHEYAEMLIDAGFTIERIFADWEDEAPEEESERIFFQVRK